jgi:hypothetical protein
MQIRTTKATLTKPTTIIWEYDNKNSNKQDKPGYKNNCNKNSNKNSHKHNEQENQNNCTKWNFYSRYGNERNMQLEKGKGTKGRKRGKPLRR